MEHIDFNLLYRWFVGLTMDGEVWDHFTFSANRGRLLNERHQPHVFRIRTGHGGVEKVTLRRAFIGGWYADPGLGFAEEFHQKGRLILATGRRRP